ncbi:MAG: arginine--tRNA ligase [Bacillota bacterium]
MQKYSKELASVISEALSVRDVILTTPPKSDMGDLALPCFTAAKELKRNPIEIARELREKIRDHEYIERIELQGAYLNIYLRRAMVIEDTLTEIALKGDHYGSSMEGRGQKALIEHTSINPNASPHVGRARNALIGDCLVRLLKFEGYEVDTQYFVNDVGKQIAMLVLGARDREQITFNDLLDIYIEINKRVAENPDLEKDVFDLLYQFENGNESVREKFRTVVDICIKGQTGILNEIGIKYDTFQYESDYIFHKRTDEILELLQDTGRLSEDSEGRYVLNQEGYDLTMKSPYLVLTRQDKTSLYPLRDIAYTLDKVRTNAARNIIVLGEDQKLYFKQVAAALDILGYPSPQVVHYSFVLLSGGKMSTRKGTVVLLEDFMDEAKEKVSQYMLKNGAEMNEDIIKAIAYGAVKYAMLKVDNEKNVTFDWDTALSFEGDTGPYIQYSYARINSIFNKYGDNLPQSFNPEALSSDIEFELVKELSYFNAVVQKALQEFRPSVLASYAFKIAKLFSRFYHECPVLNAENQEIKDARLKLLDGTRQVIKNSLQLLGIDVVEYM